MYDADSQLAAGIGQLARALRGEAPAGPPVILPLDYAVAVNRGGARALGITFPQSVQVRAGQVFDGACNERGFPAGIARPLDFSVRWES